MKELQRFQKLFSDHFDGDAWIDVNMVDTLDGIDEKAAVKNVANLNSIWQIVNHMIAWRETLLKRINNQQIASPENNFFEPIADHSALAWQQTKEKLNASQAAIVKFTGADFTDMDEHPNNGEYTRYELIQAILQHDVYHLGQIVLIKKMLLQPQY